MQAELSDGIIEILPIKEALRIGDAGVESRAWMRMLKEQMGYPRIVMLPKGVIGELILEAQEGGSQKIPLSFFLEQGRIRVVSEEKDCLSLESRLSGLIQEEGMEPVRFLLRLLDSVIQSDMRFLQNLEKVCYRFEEELLNGNISKNPFILLSGSRKSLRERSFLYQQLLEANDTMAENPCQFFSDSEVQSIRYFGSKVERLDKYGKAIREYMVLLREMYQQRLDEQQNRTMQLLTVVTTIFLPLSLIAGWYGMNFVHMPELHSPYGYVAIIAVCVMIVIGEIMYFKHKKYL